MQSTQTKTTITRQEICEMAQTPHGRIALHLLALRIDGHFEWHLAGIIRELRVLDFPFMHGQN